MTSQRRPAIGIDLGTTNSLVCVLQNGLPTILPNVLGERLTPSAVSLDEEGRILVGASAKARLTTHPALSAAAFKRDMGTDRVHQLGDKSFTSVELSSLVLGALKRDAEIALGEKIDEAVVTVPAYFGDLQREATRQAGHLAGLKIERIINEPTAAALAYGLKERNVEQRIAVLDLGGGTFDVTILEIIEGVIEIQSSSGDTRLGGEDFDESLVALLVSQFEAKHGPGINEDRRAKARLKAAAEQARHQLSERAASTIYLPGIAVGSRIVSFEAELARSDAERAWQPLLARLRKPVEIALNDAKLRADQLDAVLLVGGATRMPCVIEAARQMFGRAPLQSLPPDEAIAMGAAVQAALKASDKDVGDLVVTDVAPFSLGIATSARRGREVLHGLFTPIIERGTTIPVSRVERFSTMSDFQKEIRVEVYQGEHLRCELNQRLGDYVLKNLPPAPAGQPFDVRFTYDLNGILEVEMELRDSGRKESFAIEKRSGAMSPEQLEAARSRMSSLKLHPREALPNATAVARAEALYVELSGDARTELADAIATFRAILEGQRAGDIAHAREVLVSLTQLLRRRSARRPNSP